MYSNGMNTVQLTTDPVPGLEVNCFAGIPFATIAMALLAVAGFVLLQWFLFDVVSWTALTPGHPL